MAFLLAHLAGEPTAHFSQPRLPESPQAVRLNQALEPEHNWEQPNWKQTQPLR